LDELSGVFAGRVNASSRASSARDACVLRRNPLVRRGKLRGQRQDQRVLLGVAQLAEVGRKGHPVFSVDSAIIVSRISYADPPGSLTTEPIAWSDGRMVGWSDGAVVTQAEQIQFLA
jgi:hypothetical protein